MQSEVQKFLSAAGKKGGKKTALRGSEFYSRIGKKGMQKRWGKRRRAGDK